MSLKPARSMSRDEAETVIREELARADLLISTALPTLRHLLANNDHSMFSDAIVARVRGMLSDVARQLLSEIPGNTAVFGNDDRLVSPLVAAFHAHPGFLAHAHAIALEWQLGERLQSRCGVDPTCSPLLKELIESQDRSVAGNAVALLSAQARFSHAQRHMRLPLGELPPELLHAALGLLRELAGDSPEAAIRARYDESQTRLGLIARLVTNLQYVDGNRDGEGRSSALSLPYAGIPIFLTALALASGHHRDLTALFTCRSQVPRFALALRTAGCELAEIDERCFALHADIMPPKELAEITPARAAALLALSPDDRNKRP